MTVRAFNCFRPIDEFHDGVVPIVRFFPQRTNLIFEIIVRNVLRLYPAHRFYHLNMYHLPHACQRLKAVLWIFEEYSFFGLHLFLFLLPVSNNTPGSSNCASNACHYPTGLNYPDKCESFERRKQWLPPCCPRLAELYVRVFCTDQ